MTMQLVFEDDEGLADLILSAIDTPFFCYKSRVS